MKERKKKTSLNATDLQAALIKETDLIKDGIRWWHQLLYHGVLATSGTPGDFVEENSHQYIMQHLSLCRDF